MGLSHESVVRKSRMLHLVRSEKRVCTLTFDGLANNTDLKTIRFFFTGESHMVNKTKPNRTKRRAISMRTELRRVKTVRT